MCICSANRANKISLHIVFNETMSFEYIMQQKFIWRIVNSQLAKYCLKFRIDEALYKSPSTLRTVYSSKFDSEINKNKLGPIIKEVTTHKSQGKKL